MTGMFLEANSFDQDLSDWDVSSTRYPSLYLSSESFSSANYDKLLIGWSMLNLQRGVSFYSGDVQFGDAGAAARAKIIQDFAWDIYDGGPL